MNTLTLTALILSALAGIFHFLFFLMESVFFKMPAVSRRFGISSGDADKFKTVFLNQGFYNLFLTAGTAAGIYMFLGSGSMAVLVYVNLFMTAAGLVLFLSKPALLRAALIQAGFPLLALAFFYAGMQ